MNVLDLFSGIGGFSLGLERAGMKTVAFCECEPYAKKVLAKHWPGVPIYDDVKEVSSERLQADGICGVDVVTGGFPCQDLSRAGKRAGINGQQSGLWGELCRIVADVRPSYAIFENVKDLLTGEQGAWFDRLLGDLAAIRYDAEWHCIPAYYVGSPHTRDRVWIVAYPMQPGAAGRRPGWIGRGCRSQGEAGPYGWPGGASENVQLWPEPGVGRVVDGVSDGVDRINRLGNAVIPEIPEMIGLAILAAMNE